MEWMGWKGVGDGIGSGGRTGILHPNVNKSSKEKIGASFLVEMPGLCIGDRPLRSPGDPETQACAGEGENQQG